jgi:surface protein
MALERTDYMIVGRNNKNYSAKVKEVVPAVEDFDMIPGPPVITIGGVPLAYPEPGDVIEIFREGSGPAPRDNQWQRDGVNIAGENGETYTIVSQDLGKAITLEQTFSDGDVQGSNIVIAPRPVMPWDNWVGGVWHVKNADQEVTFNGGPYSAYTPHGDDLNSISSVNTGEEVIFLTDATPTSLFARNNTAKWDFGEETNTSNVESMYEMFCDLDEFNGTLGGNWDTSNVTNMGRMFKDASSFSQDIDNWNVSNVENMNQTFAGCEAFDQDITRWDVSQVKDMSGTFSGAAIFNQDLSSWIVSSVETMSSMFSGATVFNSDISSWITSDVLDMSSMFADALAFNKDIGGWDTEKVTVMDSMFNGASSFNRSLGNWCVTSITSEPTDFATGAISWTEDKPCWGHCPPKGDLCPPPMPWDNHNGGVFHIKEHQDDVGWKIRLQGGPYLAWFTDGTPLGEISIIGLGEEVVFVTDPITEDLFRAQNSPYHDNSRTTWEFGEFTDVSRVTDFGGMFEGCKFFDSPSVISWDVSNAKNMESMFYHANIFNQDISVWNMTGVENTGSMFSLAQGFNVDIGRWDMSNVTNMEYMFGTATTFNQYVGDWNTSNVTMMSRVFLGTPVFNQDISTKEVTIDGITYTAWDTSNVTDMEGMFDTASVFDQNIGNWDTANVTNMDNMFELAKRFNQDLSGWCVSKIPTAPRKFDEGADAYWNNRPNWGAPCS